MSDLLRAHTRATFRLLAIIALSVTCNGVLGLEAQPGPQASVWMASASVPFYPNVAEAAGIEGTIAVEVEVRDGAVVQADAGEGPILLKRAAVGECSNVASMLG